MDFRLIIVRIVWLRKDPDSRPAVDVETFGKSGCIVRPHPNARGAAHPKYLERKGFLSIAPRWNTQYTIDVIKDGTVAVAEFRKTKADEPFLALLKEGTITDITHILLLYDVEITFDRVTHQVYFGTDGTSSKKNKAFENAVVLPLDAEVTRNGYVYVVRPEGLVSAGLPKGISPEDKLD